jgi:glycosyltransferase involved in cell wall biosynthesis
MRILMTADTVGGVWTYALELARAVGVHGVEVGLATMGAAVSQRQRRQVESLSNVTLFESAYKLEWMEEPWGDVEAAGRWLLEVEEEFRPDVVHLNGYAHGALPWRAPVLVAAHSCVVSWWRAVRGEDPPAALARYREEVTRGLWSADMVVSPSRAMLNEVVRIYGSDSGTEVPLPVSGSFPPNRVIYNARTRALFGPGKKDEMVLTAGRVWDEAKNIAALERVASQLNWPVCVAGERREPGRDGNRSEGLSGQTRMAAPPAERNVCPTMLGLGYLEERELAGRLSRAAVYALPARYEPFGLSVLEAALSGCALVLGDIPSLREIWGEAAVYVGAEDSEGLRRAIGRLVEDSTWRTEMAVRAVKRAGSFHPRRMGNAYVAVYRHLAENGRRVGAAERAAVGVN